MNFEDQLRDVFDLDIWELKPQYKTIHKSQLGINDYQETLEVIEDEPEHLDNKSLIYTNNIESNKVINIFLVNNLNLEFLKNITESLFFNSKVNLYKIESLDLQDISNEINLFEKDFIINASDLLSYQSKKNILSQLYKYADFKVR
ncbi:MULTISPECIES: chloroquine resistance protein [unclassified Francisella]|uniref:chloroquine resistance protein n=1 Tax=unclassified Francisella TaxID=2610885 RepID=UPI002E30BBF2|nr:MULTISPECIES: chloroquine resistance protein [unclassified Francisella]MED7819815.1 chloroquine resistance protein [Francisella sp. 19S2-4]MED7830635.1 chloroquine resistance protein [Francisella sp. 19S2-10]